MAQFISRHQLMNGSPHHRRNKTSSCIDLQTMKSSNMISTEMRKNSQTDLFKGLYKGRNISSEQPKLTGSRANLLSYRGNQMDLQDIIKLKTKSRPKTSKTVEQLLQQNKQLKMSISQFKQQISKLKVELNLSNKRYQQSNEAMMANVDYYNDSYWPKDLKSHRIYGMKQQYQKFKKQFAMQKAELQQLKLQIAKSGQPELVTYTQQLQHQNKRLRQILQTKQLKTEPTTLYQKPQYQKDFVQKIDALNNLVHEYKTKIAQKDVKILFLERTIIQKDNKQNSYSRKQRKQQKLINQLMEKNDILIQNINFMKKKQVVQSIQSKSRFQQLLRIQRKNWKKIIKQKDNTLAQLEDKLKTLEQNINKNRSLLQSKHNFIGSGGRKFSTQFGNNLLLVEQRQLKSQSRRFSSQHNQQMMIFQKIAHFTDGISRSPKKASEKSLKLRKVQFVNIQQIGNLLRYRMIALGISEDQMKEAFASKFKINQSKKSQYRDAQNNSQKAVISVKSEQVQKIKIEDDIYINMKEAQQILRSFPFNLQNQQSLLLARYLIEDGGEQYVYCDQNNENRRQIVKSIMKAVIGEYRAAKEDSLAMFLKSFNKKWGPHLKSALQNYEPSGKLSRQKFIQILKSIEVSISESQLQMLIGRMSLSSNSLNQMNYNYLFQQM